MEKYETYYDLLGVPENASVKEIRAAYREMMKQWHPDKQPQQQEEAEEIAKMLNAAYETLSNHKKRKFYDRGLKIAKKKNAEDLNEEQLFESLSRAGKVFNKIKDDVILLYQMCKDSLKGEYQLKPITIGSIVVALLYFVVPIDTVPDFLPIIGYLDDLTVITMVTKAISDEIEKYKTEK